MSMSPAMSRLRHFRTHARARTLDRHMESPPCLLATYIRGGGTLLATYIPGGGRLVAVMIRDWAVVRATELERLGSIDSLTPYIQPSNPEYSRDVEAWDSH